LAVEGSTANYRVVCCTLSIVSVCLYKHAIMRTELFEGRPNPDHAPAYARYYFERTAGFTNLLDALRKNKEDIAAFIRSIPEEKADFQYADGKWSTKSVLAHITDTERIFQYRALRLSRKDETPMPGFEEDWYAHHANTDSRSLEELAIEFETVREAGIQLFQYMTPGMIDFIGTATNSPLTARSCGWILVGHSVHHRGIITERYLVDTEEIY
jgi:uncharacterized damage-inducible protein DinB